MKPILRRRHRYIWIVLAVLIPILFIISVQQIPATALQATQPDGTANTTLLTEIKQKGLTCSLLSGQGGRRQIVIELAEAIAAPAPALYLLPSNTAEMTEARLLGGLTDVQSYYFPLDSLDSKQSSYTLKIYDAIQKKTIQDITLTPKK